MSTLDKIDKITPSSINNIGILQPCKIGDIIICLPIAYHYFKLGFNIIWPIYEEYYNMFLRHIDYVFFIPIKNPEFDTFILKAKEILKECKCDKVLDLAFNFPHTKINTQRYQDQDHYTFDEFKYFLAEVPFEKKWDLEIYRDYGREKRLFDKLVKNENYVVYQKKSSDCVLNLNMSNYKGCQHIEIEPITDDIFDWLTLLEKAKYLVLIESCFTNLIDQLHLNNPNKMIVPKFGYYHEILYSKDGKHKFKGFPILKEDWKLLCVKN